MTSEEERMAMLAGRPLDALDDDELAQVESWTRLLADDANVGRARARPRGPRRRLHLRRAPAEQRVGQHQPAHDVVGAAAPRRSGRGSGDRLRGVPPEPPRRQGGPPSPPGELTGTELATSATGRTVIYKDTSGFRIELRARHLPRLDDGRFYQAWLRARRARSRSAPSARAVVTG